MPIQGDSVPGDMFGVASRLAVRTASTKPRDQQKCQFCKGGATKSLLFSDRKDYVPVCRTHEQEGRAYIRKVKAGVDDVVEIDLSAVPVYREDADPILAMAKAEPGENSFYGLRAHDPARRKSVAMEAKRIMAPIKAYEPDPKTDRRPVQLPGDKVRDKKQSPRGTKGLAPKTLLKMLGTDWKTWRMTKIHDNRLNVFVDGNRFTIYTRRG